MTQKTEVFLSKYAAHKIVMLHDKKMVVNNEIMRTPSKMIEFHQARYETSDPEEIAFLKGHSAYGIDFFSADDVNAPTAAPKEEPAPVAPPEAVKPGKAKKAARKPTMPEDVDAEAEGAGSAF